MRLQLGFFLCALGIVCTLNANIGFSPWDVLHKGFGNTAGMTIGVASIVIGVGVLLAVYFLGEKIGLGTMANMVIIGLEVDVLLGSNIIPIMHQFLFSLMLLVLGLFIMAMGGYFYMGSGFGAGPRDSLMVALHRKTKWPIGLCRGLTETMATGIGWTLGGPVGAGTIIAALGIGFVVQITYRLLKFDPKAVEHETLIESCKKMKIVS